MAKDRDYYKNLRDEQGGFGNIYQDQKARYAMYKWMQTLSDEDREWYEKDLQRQFGNYGTKWRAEYDAWLNMYNLSQGLEGGLGAQSAAALGGWEYNEQQEQLLNNIISQQSTEQAQDWEEYMRDTSALSTANQYQHLGLSPSVIAQTGSIGHNGVAAADVSMKNMAHERQMQKYQERYGLARQLLGMTSQMASAGIYGSAIAKARKSASMLSAAAAHSGLGVLKHHNGFGSGQKFNVDENGLLVM